MRKKELDINNYKLKKIQGYCFVQFGNTIIQISEAKHNEAAKIQDKHIFTPQNNQFILVLIENERKHDKTCKN